MSFLDRLLAPLPERQPWPEKSEETLARRVCLVLEWLYLEAPEDTEALSSQAYRFTHWANAPECRKNHEEWGAEFELLELEIEAAAKRCGA